MRRTGRPGGVGRAWRCRVRRCYSIASGAGIVLIFRSKSQLAIHYAHSIRDESPQTFVFWVHASTQARFKDAYKDLADQLELPGRNDPKANVLRLVGDWLRDETNGRWVMIIDNVDDVKTFHPSRGSQRDGAVGDTTMSLATYLPQSRNGAILVTSRSKDAAVRLVGGSNKTMEVLAMGEGEGLQLLRNKLQDPPIEQSAVELLRALDRIPLAVTQAAAYINRRTRMSVASYVDEFRRNNKKRESLLNWDAGELRRDESASNSVVATWQMSFEQIRQERQSAAELLSLMSFFNSRGIPESILRAYSRDVAESAGLGDDEELDSDFEEDLDTLRAYSLVTVTADSDVYEMHALVQFCTRVWLSSSGESERWEQRFIALMAQELPSGEYENRLKCQQLLPHIERLYDTEPSTIEVSKAWAQVLTNAAWYLWTTGIYNTAQQIATKAFAAREKALGTDNTETLLSATILALVLQDQGKYNESEILSRRVLEGEEKELGHSHPSTLTSVNNLALVLYYQGKYKEAEELNRRALKDMERQLGESHPSTLMSLSNLALVLHKQGNHKEAETLYERALKGRRKELGEHHPDTLKSMHNLSGLMWDQRKYNKAETLIRQALEGREKELGDRHPDTITSVENLAGLLRDQGKYKDAEILNQRALEVREKELGESHLDTLRSMNRLARVLRDLGRYRDAETLDRRALKGHVKELGDTDPVTLTDVNNLALDLTYQGKYEEAEALNHQVLEVRTQEFGEHHPDTLNSVHNLALALDGRGQYKEAEDLYRRALKGWTTKPGETHPDAFISIYCLARLMHTLHRYTEATELYQRACDGYTQHFGSQHPDTVACFSHFSILQREVGQLKAEKKNPTLADIEPVGSAEIGDRDVEAPSRRDTCADTGSQPHIAHAASCD